MGQGAHNRVRAPVWIWPVAALIHVPVLLLLAWHMDVGRTGWLVPVDGVHATTDDPYTPALSPRLSQAPGVQAIELIDIEAAELALGPRGPLDRDDQGGAAGPAAPIDVPGHDPGAAAGQRSGGPLVATGRDDQDRAHQQLWSDVHRTLLARKRTGHRRSSPESLTRRPSVDAGDHLAGRRRAKTGAPVPAAGVSNAASRGSADIAAMVSSASKGDDSAARPLLRHKQAGAIEPSTAPLIDRGPAAVATREDGPARDRVDSIAASHELDPLPVELTTPSAPGPSSGANGPRQRSIAPIGRADGSGMAAARHSARAGTGPVRATRQDPYFRRMYQRLGKAVVFPRELALALEQGEVVVRFSLRLTDGQVSSIEVIKSSGFEEFDTELVRALGVASPFGPVPRELDSGSPHLIVVAPYWFKSPLIR